tara:strand:- start:7629 stop:9449 length:1821 start_codon:yes stop_codon:yes gene_type:complete
MKNKQILVSLIGTDGSGKTSTTEMLYSSLLGNGASVAQVWCGAESYLMWPLRFLLKLFRKKKASPNNSKVSYQSELNEKHAMSQKKAFLIPFYIFLVLLDYRIQYFWKFWKNKDKEILLLDRYFFDVGVNLALTLGWSPEELIDFLQENLFRWRFPEVRVFVFVSPEVSMSRKDDIPDIDYVRLRLSYYRKIAKVFGFVEISGEANLSENTALLNRLLEKNKLQKRVHYVHCNNYDLGGADYCLNRMAVRVNEENAFSSSVSLRLKTAIIQMYEKDGIPVYRNNYSRPQLSQGLVPLILFPFTAIQDLFYFIRLFKAQNLDLVHVNDLYDFIPAFSAKILGIPTVYHIRMIRRSSFEISFFSWFMKSFSVASFSVSYAVRKLYFGDSSNCKNHRAFVIYDWPRDEMVEFEGSVSSRVPVEFRTWETVVVLIGRIEEWKGQHTFLDAVADIKEDFPRCGFFIIGGTVQGSKKEAYAKEVLSKASELGVHYLGERSDVPELLYHADISIHASTTPDPFPGVVLESMLSCSAVVGADAGGVSEMIRQDIDGIKYTAGNSSEMAKGIRRCLEDKAFCGMISSSARERILKIADKETVTKKILEIYKELLK